ncbi:hypothetical protein HYPSUDRAFT_59633, partial [Hypholoma sublateritium FD-334 SS-4]
HVENALLPTPPHTQVAADQYNRVPAGQELQQQDYPQVDNDLEHMLDVVEAANQGVPEHADQENDVVHVNEFEGRIQPELQVPVQLGGQRRHRHGTRDLFLAACKPYQEPPQRHDLGRMDVPCQKCKALHWMDE